MNGDHDMPAGRYPVATTILVTDVEGFGRLLNPQQLAVRNNQYSILADAFDKAGVPWDRCAHEDRGDGVLILIPGDIPKAVALSRVLPQLVATVAAAQTVATTPARLRIAMHAGDVHQDQHGFAGHDLNHAFRLVDSPELRQALRAAASPCAVMISDHLYQTTARHGYDGIDPDAFRAVSVHTKEADVIGWLMIPGDDKRAGLVAAGPASAASPVSQEAHGVRIRAGGDVRIEGASIAGRDITSTNQR
jgi:class 3 adenylate cyclase